MMCNVRNMKPFHGQVDQLFFIVLSMRRISDSFTADAFSADLKHLRPLSWLEEFWPTVSGLCR